MNFFTPTPAAGEAIWLNKHYGMVSSLKEADFVLFTGGSDVSPHYYKQNKGKHTYCNPSRDEVEFAVFQEAVKSNKPMIGICRGLQAIHAFQGYPLVQHMNNHNNSSHIIKVTAQNGRDFVAPGDHHQNPLIPVGTDIQLLGYCNPRSDIYLDGNNTHINVGPNYLEPEIIYYPSIKALGFQYHPEWAEDGSHCEVETLKMITNVLKLT